MDKQTKPSRRRFISTAAMTVAAAKFGSVAFAKAQAELSALEHATTWLNLESPINRQLDGKVILIEFWTYSCINWRRQLPYVRAWDAKYRNCGLVVVGVHSPEFSFERQLENIRWAVRNMNIAYPIAIDSDYSLWRAFNNQYWPALYFIDSKGWVRHQVFGEGQYDQSEALIQKLLAEAGSPNAGKELTSIDAQGAEAAADWKDLRSGENYVGYARTQNFASPGSIKTDKAHEYKVPESLRLNEWALSGDWTVNRESIALNQPGGSISYRFHARDVHFVMGPAISGRSVRYRVLIDGKAPGIDHGSDIDDSGAGIVMEPRMYQLIRQHSSIIDRQITIQFLDLGVEGYSFTFG